MVGETFSDKGPVIGFFEPCREAFFGLSLLVVLISVRIGSIQEPIKEWLGSADLGMRPREFEYDQRIQIHDYIDVPKQSSFHLRLRKRLFDVLHEGLWIYTPGSIQEDWHGASVLFGFLQCHKS